MSFHITRFVPALILLAACADSEQGTTVAAPDVITPPDIVDVADAPTGVLDVAPTDVAVEQPDTPVPPDAPDISDWVDVPDVPDVPDVLDVPDEVACVSDADCVAAEAGNKCKVDTGQCVKCLTDDDCTSIVHWWKACSELNKCVVCIDDADCAADPKMPGPICTGVGQYAKCVCKEDADCAGNAYGKSCSELGVCGCETTDDCPGDTVCQLKGWGTRYCADPCTTDDDCTWPSTPMCNAATGICGDCLHDDDCPWHHPLCDPGINMCQLCLTGADCQELSPYYAVCDFYNLNNTQCVTCKVDADCAGNPIALGDVCSGNCTCETDGDCQNTVRGKTCFAAGGPGDIGKCGCTSDAECSEDGAKCLANSGDWVTSCRVPCADNDGCAGDTLDKVCDPAFQECTQCLTNADCAALDPTLSLCFGTHCFQCTTDDDCLANPGALGPVCMDWDTGPPTCACSDDLHCAGNPNGPKCEYNMCTCADDGQCADGLKCTEYELLPYGMTTCQ